MVYYVIGLIVTFAIGAFFGVAMMCCFHMASEADRHIEENQKKLLDLYKDSVEAARTYINS